MKSTLEDPGRISTAMVVGLWLLSLLVLLIGIGNPPVTRSQEARVLETSRQMLGTGVSGWMNPMLNGQPRVKKPPLCYWMAATSYHIGGVSEGVGRIPTALLGWLTLGVVYALTSRSFDPRTALITCAVLLGSYVFFRFTRFAETDPAAMFFLTLAVYLIHRSSQSRNLIWPHLAAATVAMVILAKGAPAIFIGVFLIGYCAVERRWDVARRFVLSGAPITLLFIAVPWFLYVEDAAAAELRNTLIGGDHFDWPWVYIHELFIAAAPWSALLPLAIVQAVRSWRGDASSRFVSLWFLSILIPLCINGNKQHHYLVMLAPPMMLMVGRLLAEVPRDMQKLVNGALVLTMMAFGLGAVAGPIVVPRLRGTALPIDWIAALAVGVATLVILMQFRIRFAAALRTMLVLVALLMPVVLGYWIPSIDLHTSRQTAARITALFGPRPYVFYGRGVDLPLCFHLRSAIPYAQDEAELRQLAPPGTVVIVTSRHRSSYELPPEFEYREAIDQGDHLFVLHERVSPQQPANHHQSSVPRHDRVNSSISTQH